MHEAIPGTTFNRGKNIHTRSSREFPYLGMCLGMVETYIYPRRDFRVPGIGYEESRTCARVKRAQFALTRGVVLVVESKLVDGSTRSQS